MVGDELNVVLVVEADELIFEIETGDGAVVELEPDLTIISQICVLAKDAKYHPKKRLGKTRVCYHGHPIVCSAMSGHEPVEEALPSQQRGILIFIRAVPPAFGPKHIR